jgi:hypothetical protein
MGQERVFQAELVEGERGRVFFEVPFDPNAVWGKKARHHVRGTVAGVEFSGSLGARGGQYFFPLAKELRKTAGLDVGNKVRVALASAEAGEDELPADLAKALSGAPRAKSFFEGLSSFCRNTYVRWILSAKKAETRASRVQATLDALKAEKKQL